MTDLAFLLLLAAAGYGLARALRVAVIPILLGLGIATSAAGVDPEPGAVRATIELGVTFLAFSSGIELSFKRIRRVRRAVAWVAPVQFAVVGLAAFVLARGFGVGVTPALYVALSLSTSSTLVVLRHLRFHQQMFEPFGRVVTGTLLVQDLMMIGAIVVMARLPDGPAAVAKGLGATVLLFGLAAVAQRRVLPAVMMRWRLDEESQLLSLLAFLFLFVGAADLLGVPLIAGAFLAGFALSAFPINGVARSQIASISGFFLAIFFIALGFEVSVPALSVVLHALAYAALVVVVTPPLVTVIAEKAGLTSRSAIESGLLLAQTSEFSLILCLSGLALGHLSAELFSTLALATALTMAATPMVASDAVARILLHAHPDRRRVDAAPGTDDDDPPSGHVLVLGFGNAGMWIIKPLLAVRHRLLVVDDDPAVIRSLRRSGIPCLRGDGSDEAVLERAGARRARAILSAMRRVRDAERMLDHASPGTPVIVRVFEDDEAERIRRVGGIPVSNAHAAADLFAEWFDDEIGSPPAASDASNAPAASNTADASDDGNQEVTRC